MKKLKGGAIYDENDINTTVLLGDIKYIKDKDKEEPLLDIINMEPIEQDRAILVNNQIYDIESIYKWIVIHEKTYCPLRIKVTNSKDIIAKYTSTISRVTISSTSITFKDDIKRLDIILTNNGNYYSYTWYNKSVSLFAIHGIKTANSTATVPIVIKNIIGYVLVDEPAYDNYKNSDNGPVLVQSAGKSICNKTTSKSKKKNTTK
jgi:hypothetical protein